MKKSTRIMTALLALVMVLGMLPMAAFAADNTHVLEAKDLEAFGEGSKAVGDTTTTADGYFTLYWAENAKVDKSNKTFDDGYESAQRINFGGKATIKESEVKHVVKFTTTGAATVKIWWVCAGDDRTMDLFKEDGTHLVGTEPAAKDSKVISTLTIDAAGTYYLGGKVNKNYIFKIEVNEQTSGSSTPSTPTTPVAVTEPVAGTTYKLGMFQGNADVQKQLYFAGTVANTDYYLATTESYEEATEVTVEAVEGGYRIFFMADNVKTYIDIYENGTYVNLRLTTEPTAVFTWNAEYHTFQTMIGETPYYMGTYKTYVTLSASKLDYISTSYPCQLYAVQTVEPGPGPGTGTGGNGNPNTGDMIPFFLLTAIASMGAVLLLKKKAF